MHKTEATRVLALRAASEFHMRRATNVLRISSAIPVVGNPDRYSPVIHNVLDPGFEEALAQIDSKDATAAEGKIVCIGSVLSYRNLRRTIQAHQQLNDGRELLICGPIGNRAIANDIGSLTLESRGVSVRWGSISRATCLAYFRAADTVILPSLVEASPFSALEALAVQPRVVLSDIVGHREILEQFAAVDDCVFFDPLSVESIAKALATRTHESSAPHRVLSDGSTRASARERWASDVVRWLGSLAFQN